jgi:hypothetical protein
MIIATTRPKTRSQLRLILICFAALMLAFVATVVDAASIENPQSRVFWVTNSSRLQRQTHATLQASGNRALIYVEDSLSFSPEMISRLEWQLESAVPAGAFQTGIGLVSLEESLFGPILPTKTIADNRLIILFCESGPAPDGAFLPIDQTSEAEAFSSSEHLHSNEANVLYLGGAQPEENAVIGIISRELQRLLAYRLRPEPREIWLSDSLAKGGELISGYFGEQSSIQDYLSGTGYFPLVTPNPHHQGGAQLLFASFLIDTLPQATKTALSNLSEINKSGRDAIEQLFWDLTREPTSFDAIFSNFVSYIFAQAQGESSLPTAWRHSPGLQVPLVSPFALYYSDKGELTGSLAPYSFVAIDLDRPLSSHAQVQLTKIDPKSGSDKMNCSTNAHLLWKPVSETRIAIYAVGCDPSINTEMIRFRLKIVDPSLVRLGSINSLADATGKRTPPDSLARGSSK